MKKKNDMNNKELKKMGLQRNHYLDELGIPIKDYGTNFCDKTDERWKCWKKEQKKYGFDNRETWNIDRLFVEWLYSHFKMYKEACGGTINFEYHKFKYRGKDITQKKAINIILDACKKYLLSHDYVGDGKDMTIYSPEIMTLLGELLPAMWW